MQHADNNKKTFLSIRPI